MAMSIIQRCHAEAAAYRAVARRRQEQKQASPLPIKRQHQPAPPTPQQPEQIPGMPERLMKPVHIAPRQSAHYARTIVFGYCEVEHLLLLARNGMYTPANKHVALASFKSQADAAAWLKENRTGYPQYNRFSIG